MPMIVTNGVRYFMRSAGSGPPLLLLHGFSGSSEHWEKHIDAFAEYYTVIAIDLLGHGRSSVPTEPARYAVELVSQDLAAVLSILGHSPACLLGYSMGGRLALYFALRHPELVSHLILESVSPGLETAEARALRREQDEMLARRILDSGLETFVNEWEALPLFATQKRLPEAVRHLQRQRRLANNPLGLANSLIGMGTGAQPSLWPHLKALNTPIQLIVGELDTKFREINQQMRASLANASLTIIPNAGHTTHLEQPELFRKHVLDFLARP